MAFILTEQRNQDVVAAFRRYRQYLIENRTKFPPSAFALANSSWYFDPHDHRCPHDGWLEDLSIVQSPVELDKKKRIVSIRITLLAAYHDQFLQFYYPKVSYYSLAYSGKEFGHRDWLYDEFRLSESGIVHEIEWSGPTEDAHWIIHASDVEFSVIQKQKQMRTA